MPAKSGIIQVGIKGLFHFSKINAPMIVKKKVHLLFFFCIGAYKALQPRSVDCQCSGQAVASNPSNYRHVLRYGPSGIWLEKVTMDFNALVLH